jgi:hypothetical protein
MWTDDDAVGDNSQRQASMEKLASTATSIPTGISVSTWPDMQAAREMLGFLTQTTTFRSDRPNTVCVVLESVQEPNSTQDGRLVWQAGPSDCHELR